MLRRTLTALLLLAGLGLVISHAQGRGEFGFPDGDRVHDPRPSTADIETTVAVYKGLAHLAAIQNHNGSWSNDVGNKLGNRYQRNVDGIGADHLGVTAICCMAFMAAGHTPDRGEFRTNVASGLKFITSAIDEDTGWTTHNGTRMYSHAFCAMFLAEVYGQTRDTVVLKPLRNVVKFILDSQNPQGAWRYVPDQADSDMSICVCQLQALRAAANVGVDVPENRIRILSDGTRERINHIERARDYVRASYNFGGRNGPRGSFKYQIDWDGRSTFALTAAGVVALQSLGEYDTHTYIDERGNKRTLDLNSSIEFLIRERPDNKRMGRFLVPGTQLCDYGFWYGHYYAAQAMYQYQFVSKRVWEEWHELNREHFLKLQHSNGAWTDEIGGFDPRRNAYATGMACLILSIPRGYLPIFHN